MTQALPVSAFVICKNEAEYIENCLRSLDICSEIVVVDSGSTDETPALIRSLAEEGLPIRFMHHDWPGYAAQKQFALEQCTQPWCLSIDADERLDDGLRKSLPELLSASEDVSAWGIRRRNYLIGFGYPAKDSPEHHLVRLVRKGRARFDLGTLVHERLIVDGNTRNARTGTLLHFRPLRLADQMLKENQYSSLKVEQLLRAGRKLRPFRLVFGPIWYFFRLFVMRRLYRCGWAGFIEAGTGAVYAFLTEAKLMQHYLEARKLPVEADGNS